MENFHKLRPLVHAPRQGPVFENASLRFAPEAPKEPGVIVHMAAGSALLVEWTTTFVCLSAHPLQYVPVALEKAADRSAIFDAFNVRWINHDAPPESGSRTRRIHDCVSSLMPSFFAT